MINLIRKALAPRKSRIEDWSTPEASTTRVHTIYEAYRTISAVNRGINMIVDDAAALPVKVYGKLGFSNENRSSIKAPGLATILNYKPNPFEDASSFKRKYLMDFLLDGNIFLYFDKLGNHLYHLPAKDMVVHPDSRNYISHFELLSTQQEYSPSEIIHVKDNSYQNDFRGSSRLTPLVGSAGSLLGNTGTGEVDLLTKLKEFQANFFKNNATPGLVLTSENMLSQRFKERTLDEWRRNFNPTSGGRRPAFLDAGIKISPVSSGNFKELDFQTAVKDLEESVYKLLGIPPVLINSGNNANIRPNHRLYYLETIIPIVDKVNSALQAFFAYEIAEDLSFIEAMRPELRDQSAYLTGLVNGGILSPNEARIDLGKEPKGPEFDDIRVPANVAGSAINPGIGGRPPNANEDN